MVYFNEDEKIYETRESDKTCCVHMEYKGLARRERKKKLLSVKPRSIQFGVSEVEIRECFFVDKESQLTGKESVREREREKLCCNCGSFAFLSIFFHKFSLREIFVCRSRLWLAFASFVNGLFIQLVTWAETLLTNVRLPYALKLFVCRIFFFF